MSATEVEFPGRGMGISAGISSGHDGEQEHRAHHYSSHEHQYEAAKFGLWIFLATEILMFSGVFCAIAVLGNQYPEGFKWGRRLLSVNIGFTNTLVLITSSFTMAYAVRAAMKNQRKLLVVLLGISFLCGALFMSLKFIEYRTKYEHGLLPGAHFNPSLEFLMNTKREEEKEKGGKTTLPDAARSALGEQSFLQTCAACHGNHAEGRPDLGVDLRTSAFVKEHGNDELVGFITKGRLATAADSRTKREMPPKGANPALSEENIQNIVQFLRLKQMDADPAQRVTAPAGGNLFFSAYFIATGLHGIHVLVGMGLLLWLAALSTAGKFNPSYFTPVETVGLYWHLVDVIWIYLFPIVYLVIGGV